LVCTCPLHLSTGVLAGGVIRWFIDKSFDGDILKSKVEKGILFASGLIAGDALMGILIAGLAFNGLSGSVAIFSKLSFASSDTFGFAMFVILGLILHQYVYRGKAEGEVQEKDPS
jgi:hypothetical protein